VSWPRASPREYSGLWKRCVCMYIQTDAPAAWWSGIVFAAGTEGHGLESPGQESGIYKLHSMVYLSWINVHTLLLYIERNKNKDKAHLAMYVLIFIW
jgi:hypothetical protein